MRYIHYTALNKQEWLNYIPTVIKTLSETYHFYWSCLCHHIKDLDTLIRKKKDWYKCRMALYNDEYMYYFVVYCKNKIDVYKLVDGYCNTNSKKSYFMRKWKKYYKCSEE